MALGAPCSTRETEDPLGPEGMDLAIPALMATLTQMSPWVTTQIGTLSSAHFTHPLLQPTMLKTLEEVSMCTFPSGVVPGKLLDQLLLLQEKMNAALEQ